MRHLLAIALASLAAAACSSAPTDTETAASTAQDLVFCPVGTTRVCTGSVCKCVATPPPPQCGFETEAPTYDIGPPYTWYIEAWATEQTNGQCPDVPAATGTWKNVDPNYPHVPNCFMGVPCINGDPQMSAPSCTALYPTQPCCTYVWWPAGFTLQPITLEPTGYSCYAPVESACSAQPADMNALCQEDGQIFKAIELPSCTPVTVNGQLYSCGSPGGSSCNGSCGHI